MIDKEQLDEQIQILTAWARRNMTYEQATLLFAVHKVVLDHFQALYAQLSEQHQQASTMLIKSGVSDRKRAALLKEMAAEWEAAVPRWLRQAAAAGFRAYKRQASKRAKDAADHRHNSPGGARDKAEAIKNAWASGKYSSRDRCAEEECAALGMSFSAARRALRKTPDPS